MQRRAKTALLARRTPLAREDVDALRRHCRKHKFSESSPPTARRPGPQPARRGGRALGLRGGRARRRGAAQAEGAAEEADLTPPTDDRPFFAYTVPARRLPAVLGDVEAPPRRARRSSRSRCCSPSARSLFALGVLLGARRAPSARAPRAARRRGARVVDAAPPGRSRSSPRSARGSRSSSSPCSGMVSSSSTCPRTSSRPSS